MVHAAIAAFVLWANPRRTENWLVILILTLTGASALIRFFLLYEDDPARTLMLERIILKYEWPGSLLVLSLALVYPVNHLRTRARRLAWAACLTPFLVVWGVVIASPETIYEVTEAGRLHSADWFVILVDDARYFVATCVALALFARAHARRPAGSHDVAGGLLFAAFAVGPLLSAPLLIASRHEVVFATTFEILFVAPHVKMIITFLGALAILAVVAHGLHRISRAGQPVRLLVIVLGAVLAFGVYLIVPVATSSTLRAAIGSYGDVAYLILRPVLLGYALVKFQLFDVDVRVKRGVATTIGILLVGFVFFPVEQLVRSIPGLPDETASTMSIAVALGVTLALYGRVQGVAHGASAAIFQAVREEDSRYLESRRRELYRAAIERALDDRLELTPHRAEEVTRLRARLGIREDEHASILREVRNAIRAGPAAVRVEAANPGSLLLGRYRVQRLLGEGGGGRTYACRDERLERVVAVKEIEVGSNDARAWREALREARRLARVQHPNVVGVYDVHDSGSRAFVVMELVEGGSLAERLRQGPLGSEEAARVLEDVLKGLAALHEAGLVHRDVKPSNVLLDSHGRSKVADLGIARGDATVTRTGMRRAGTPAYMAPEQILGLAVDPRTDLYACAALLFECLAGESYVRKAAREGILVEEAVVSLPPPIPLEGQPAWANAFLGQGLAKDPDRRFPDASSALEALRRRSFPGVTNPT